MIVIGLSGYKGSGKDTVADILVRDYGFTKMAFADYLKDMVRALDPMVGVDLGSYYCNCESCGEEWFPVRLSDLYDDMKLTDDEIKKSEYGPEVRRLWERFGTEVMREADSHYWIDKAEERLKETPRDRVVFTDVRFENEAEWIQSIEDEPGWKNRAALWRIARPGTFGGEHPAEQMAGLLGEEATILNDGTIDDLREPVAMGMALLLNPHRAPRQMEFDFGGTYE